MGIITEIKIIQRNKQRNNNFHNLTYKISRVEKNDLPIEGKNHNYTSLLEFGNGICNEISRNSQFLGLMILSKLMY